ncbi:response regulator [Sphingomonas guangdongensis]|uniref:response regulator n=1 Tax=Sphingomonas guangdongensis TaxID=1141890 RepID=UPI0015CCC897|nr:response regulator [Sphingomonas guangdongensis]
MDDDRTRDLRILCVDDDPDIRLIVELSLHLDPDMRAITVGSAVEALSVLEEQTFDVVLLDALMPELDGLGLLERMLRGEGGPPTPVVFLTADALRRSRYDRAGVLGVISKPFDPMKLAEVVRALVTNVGSTRVVGY